jgi:serine/threonine-protein kinase HipA
MDSEAFFLLHQGLARESPGSPDSTREAIRRLPPLPPQPQILDLGCGPGQHSLILAQTLNASVLGIDLHEPFLMQLQQAAAIQGLSHLIATRSADISLLDIPSTSVDLIWSEGAIYTIGFATGLRLWRSLLQPAGQVVVSELTWIKPNPPSEVAEFWQRGYPAMSSVADNINAAVAEGYEVFDWFTLSCSDWWENYYAPLSDRIDQLQDLAQQSSAFRQVLDEHQREIQIWQSYQDYYNYVFYLMRKSLA